MLCRSNVVVATGKNESRAAREYGTPKAKVFENALTALWTFLNVIL
jgi:hypothetical protein